MAKHRRVQLPASRAARLAAIAGVAGTAIAVPLVGATSASAASVSTWDAVARCESGGDWHINTGNGYFGGLQFSASSWDGAGGQKYAPRADLATKDQQIAVAETLLAQQGPDAWSCASAGGLTSGGPAPDVHPGQASTGSATQTGSHAAPAKKAPATKAAPAGHAAGGYLVKSGDTLSSIARARHVAGGWHKLFDLNKDLVKKANLIFPGQRLRLS